VTDDARPFRRNSDPSTAHAAAVVTRELEGPKRLVRRNSGRHFALLILAAHPCGLAGYDVGREMHRVFGFGRTAQDPADIGRRRVNEVAALGAAARVDNLYLPNVLTHEALAAIDAGGEWRPTEGGS